MWPLERLTPDPGARLTLSPNWRFHFPCSVQRSEPARCLLGLFIRIVNRLYLPVIFQDASEPVARIDSANHMAVRSRVICEPWMSKA